jgi:hypothetical protein
MYSLIVFPSFLQYLTSAKDLISSLSVTSKPTLMIPNNFIYNNGFNFDGRILNTILYEVGTSDIPR